MHSAAAHQQAAILDAAALLHTAHVAVFDQLVRLVVRALDTPVALVTVVGFDTQYFIGMHGLSEPWASARHTPLSHSFCHYVVAAGAPLIVSDARNDPLLATNLAVDDLQVIAYLGVPFLAHDGRVLGAVCAIDHQPRVWGAPDLAFLHELATIVSSQFALLAKLGQAPYALRQPGQVDLLRDDDHARAVLVETEASRIVQKLRDLLAVIVGNLDLVALESASAPPLPAAAADIRTAAYRASDLTKQLGAYIQLTPPTRAEQIVASTALRSDNRGVHLARPENR